MKKMMLCFGLFVGSSLNLFGSDRPVGLVISFLLGVEEFLEFFSGAEFLEPDSHQLNQDYLQGSPYVPIGVDCLHNLSTFPSAVSAPIPYKLSGRRLQLYNQTLERKRLNKNEFVAFNEALACCYKKRKSKIGFLHHAGLNETEFEAFREKLACCYQNSHNSKKLQFSYEGYDLPDVPLPERK